MRKLSQLAIPFLLALLPLVASIPDVRLTSDPTTAAFSISVDGAPWFTSGTPFFRSTGQLLSPLDGSLTVTAYSPSEAGTDSVGSYDVFTWVWGSVNSSSFAVETSIKAYHSLNTEADQPPPPRRVVRAVVFTQRYLTRVAGTNTTRQSVVSGYPTFLLPTSAKPRLGFYQWASQFFWTNRFAAEFNATADLYGGVENGPFVVYDTTATTTALFMPFDSFMDSSMCVTAGADGTGPRQVSYGGLGNFQYIPAGWSMSTMVYFNDVGVTEGVLAWGDVMRAVYGKSRETSANDLVNSWLGYNTDRGATYYFYNEPNTTYEETMYMVKDYADSLHLPYKYWLSDSRWYLHGKDGGVVTWDPEAEFFSQGFANLTKRLNWKLVAHNRYFSSESTYAKQNGGKYEWIVQGNSSLPIDQQFWIDLFAERSDWGLTMLFQDWLYTVSDGIDAVNEIPGIGETWLRQMATGAEAAGVSIQYCMSLARHLLASVQYRAVTQIRVSNDGMPNDVFNQWQIGESAVLAFALGVIPFKDNFWTTPVQCENPYYPAANCTEPNTALESAVASFSTGAVAPGDGVGQSNASLIMRSVTSEGRLLKPTRPMSSLDLWYAANAFTAGGISWQLQATHSDVGGWQWWYVLAVDNAVEVVVTRDALHMDGGRYLQWRAVQGVDDWSTLGPMRADHTLPASHLPDFVISHLAPVLEPSPIVLLGERTKWVKISTQRISTLDVTALAVTLHLAGGAGELVEMQFAVSNTTTPQVITTGCMLPPTGKAVLAMHADGTWMCNSSAMREVQLQQETQAMAE